MYEATFHELNKKQGEHEDKAQEYADRTLSFYPITAYAVLALYHQAEARKYEERKLRLMQDAT